MILSDKKVCIIGAAGLLGYQLVVDCLELGAEVIAVDLDLEKLNYKLSQETYIESSERLSLKTLDITDEIKVVDFFNNIGSIDGLVNCAYPRNSEYGTAFGEVSLSSFNENVSLNLGTSFLLMQEAANYFLANKTPLSLVNIASIYGVVAPKFEIYEGTNMTTPVEYAAIKAAIIHLNLLFKGAMYVIIRSAFFVVLSLCVVYFWL